MTFTDLPITTLANRKDLTALYEYLTDYIETISSKVKVTAALEDGAIVGLVVHTDLTIINLYVVKEERRQGYGRALVEYVINTNRSAIYTNVPASDTGAVSLFLQLGFSIQGRWSTTRYPGEHYKMTRPYGNYKVKRPDYMVNLESSFESLAKSTPVIFNYGVPVR